MLRRNNELTELGKEVKKRAIDKNMTMVELAKTVGTTASYLDHIIYGRKSGQKYIGIIKQVLDIA